MGKCINERVRKQVRQGKGPTGGKKRKRKEEKLGFDISTH